MKPIFKTGRQNHNATKARRRQEDSPQEMDLFPAVFPPGVEV